MRIENVTLHGNTVTLAVAVEGATALCPLCRCTSTRVHSRYRRTLMLTDLSVNCYAARMRDHSTRDHLLATAGDLFYTQGLTATGVDTIVRASGLSKPTLYAHFGSKAELAAAVLDRRHRARVDELEAWVARTADPRDRPLAVFAWLSDWYSRAGARGCAFVNAAAELPHPEAPARRVAQREKRWLLAFLTRLTREAGVAQAERLAAQLVLLIDGVAAHVVVHGTETAVHAVADAAAAARVLVEAAIAAPPRPSPATPAPRRSGRAP